MDDADLMQMIREYEAKKESAGRAKENLTNRNEFVRGLVRGTDQMQATYQGGAGMLASLAGDKVEARRRFGNYQDEMQQSTENPATVDKFFSADPKSGAMASPGNMATWAAGTAGSLIPSVAESALSGVAGAAAGAALFPAPDPLDAATIPIGGIAGLFSKGAVKKAIAEAADQYIKQGFKREAAEQMGGQAVRNIIAKRGGATFAAQQTTALNEGGGFYMEGREKGYDNPVSAFGLGQISGASEVSFGVFPKALGMVFKKAGVSEVAKKSGLKVAAEYAWNIGQEFGQEAFQEWLGSVNESINDPKAKILTIDNFVKWMESGAAGALGGAMFVAGGAATSAYQNRGQQPPPPPDGGDSQTGPLKSVWPEDDTSDEDTGGTGDGGDSQTAVVRTNESEVDTAIPVTDGANGVTTTPTQQSPADRVVQLQKIMSKGYVAVEDGIAGKNRTDRWDNAKAKLAELEEQLAQEDVTDESEAGTEPFVDTEVPPVTTTEPTVGDIVSPTPPVSEVTAEQGDDGLWYATRQVPGRMAESSTIGFKTESEALAWNPKAVRADSPALQTPPPKGAIGWDDKGQAVYESDDTVSRKPASTPEATPATEVAKPPVEQEATPAEVTSSDRKWKSNDRVFVQGHTAASGRKIPNSVGKVIKVNADNVVVQLDGDGNKNRAVSKDKLQLPDAKFEVGEEVGIPWTAEKTATITEALPDGTYEASNGRRLTATADQMVKLKPAEAKPTEKVPPVAPSAESRIAEIDKELERLQSQYEKKSNQQSKSAMVPPSIKGDALSQITKKMDKLDTEKKALQAEEASSPPKQPEAKSGDIVSQEPPVAEVAKPPEEAKPVEQAVKKPVRKQAPAPETTTTATSKRWFHGSHDNVSEFTNRKVSSVDDIGTWATGTPESASSRYGPKVLELEVTPKNLLEAHTDNFDELFFSNENLFKKTFPDAPVSKFSDFRGNKTTEKVRDGTWKMRSAYLSAYRQMLESAGYDGIVWKDSTIDQQGGDKQDVAVFFHKEPIKAKSSDTVSQNSSTAQEEDLSVDELADIFANPEQTSTPKSNEKAPTESQPKAKKPRSVKKDPKAGVQEGLDEAKEGASLFLKALKDITGGSTSFANVPMNADIARALGMMTNGLIKAGKYKFAEFVDAIAELVGIENAKNYAPVLELGWSKKAEVDNRLDKAGKVAEVLPAAESEEGIVYRVDGPENTEAQVRKHDKGWSVALWDKDANKNTGEFTIFPTRPEAIEYARTIIEPAKPSAKQPTYKELRSGFDDYSTTNRFSSGADSPALWQQVKQVEGENVFTYYVVDTSAESVILSTSDYDQAKTTWDKETELFNVNKAREQDKHAEESDEISKAKKKAISDDLDNRKSQDAQAVSAQDLDKPLTGKPIVVTGFHGSKDAFEEFDPSRRGETDPGFLGPAYYFYADEALAKKHGENVIRRDLRINKPLDYAQMMAAKVGSSLREVNERYDEVYDREMDIALAQERKGFGEQPAYWRARAAALATVAREFGYDGVIMRGGKVDDFPNTEIAVFDPPEFRDMMSQKQPDFEFGDAPAAPKDRVKQIQDTFKVDREVAITADILLDAFAYPREVEIAPQGTPIPRGSQTQISKASAKMKATGEKYPNESIFFRVWDKFLRAVGGKRLGLKSTKKAVSEAIEDMATWIEENPRFVDYYSHDNPIERAAITKLYPELGDDANWALYKIITAVASPGTNLDQNTAEQINAWGKFRESNFERFDVEFERSERGHPTFKRSGFQIHGAYPATKALHYSMLNEIIKQQGGIEQAVKWLVGTVPANQIRMLPKQVGGGETSGKQVQFIRQNVEFAWGTAEQIPRMFIFGPKEGAYALNHLGQHEFTTVDVWESRFWRSFFKDVPVEIPSNIEAEGDEAVADYLEKRRVTGIEEDLETRGWFLKAGRAFAEALDMTPAEAQAVRWFYVIQQVNEAGYGKARSYDTISGYTAREVAKRQAAAASGVAGKKETSKPRKNRRSSSLRNLLGDTIFGEEVASDTLYQESSIWMVPEQEVSSSDTSVNKTKTPATFKNVEWQSGTVNADIGGGAFDTATEYLSEKGVENIIYDPFNRSPDHNKKAVARISGGQADTATVNNVLNVIKESGNRDLVISQAADAIKQDGTAYFLIYEGNKSSDSNETSKGWQENRPVGSYVSEIERHFDKVVRRGNLLVASQPIKTQPLFQKQRDQQGTIQAWTHFVRAAKALVADKAIIGATDKADVSSPFHELGHPMREFLFNRNVSQEERGNISLDDIQVMEEFVGVEYDKKGKPIWERKDEEKFVDALMKYWREGTHPNKQIETIFQKISKWLSGVFSVIERTDKIKLTDEIRAIFAKVHERGGVDPKKLQALKEASPSVEATAEVTHNKNRINDKLDDLFGDIAPSEARVEALQQLEAAGIKIKQTPKGWSVTVPKNLLQGIKDGIEAEGGRWNRKGYGYYSFKENPTNRLVPTAEAILDANREDDEEAAAGLVRTPIGFLSQEDAERYRETRQQRLDLAVQMLNNENALVDELLGQGDVGDRGLFKIALMRAAEKSDFSSVKGFDKLVAASIDHPEYGLPQDEQGLFERILRSVVQEEDIEQQIDAELANEFASREGDNELSEEEGDGSFNFGALAEPAPLKQTAIEGLEDDVARKESNELFDAKQAKYKQKLKADSTKGKQQMFLTDIYGNADQGTLFDVDGVAQEDDDTLFQRIPQTDTPEFKKWFGNSKVVDEDGEPLVVYHGTTESQTLPVKIVKGNAAAYNRLKQIHDELVADGTFDSSLSDITNLPLVLERIKHLRAKEARDAYEKSKAQITSKSSEEMTFDVFEAGELGSHFGTEQQASGFGSVFQFFLSIKNPLRLPDMGTWNYQSVIREARKRGVKITELEYDRIFNASDNDAALRDVLKSKGYDGVVYENEAEGPGNSYIAFEPTQIKSATGNSGAFDPANPNILFQASKSPEDQAGEILRSALNLKKMKDGSWEIRGVTTFEDFIAHAREKFKLRDDQLLQNAVNFEGMWDELGKRGGPFTKLGPVGKVADLIEAAKPKPKPDKPKSEAAKPEPSKPKQPKPEPSAEEEDTTGTKHAKTDELRAKYGFDERVPPAPETFQEWEDQARRKYPDAASRLQVVELAERHPNQISKIENAAIGQHIVDLENRREAGEDVLDELLRTIKASTAAGSEAGRDLVSRKAERYGDFSLAGLVKEHIRTVSKDPTEEQMQVLTELADRIKQLEADKQELAKKLAEEAIARKKAEAAAKPKPEPAQEKKGTKREILKKKVESAVASFKDKWKSLVKAGATLFQEEDYDPDKSRNEIIQAAGEVIKAYREMEIASFIELQAQLKKDGIDLDEQQTKAFKAAWDAQQNKAVSPIGDNPEQAAIGARAKELMALAIEAGYGATKETWMEVVNAVHAQLSIEVPGISEYATMQAMSDYGVWRALNKEESAAKARAIRGKVQQSLKIEDTIKAIAKSKELLESGVSPEDVAKLLRDKGLLPKATGQERATPDSIERALIAEFNKLKKDLPVSVESREGQLKSALTTAKTAGRNRLEALDSDIKALEESIAKREALVKPVDERTQLKPDEDLIDIRKKLQTKRKRRDDLKAEYEKIFPPAKKDIGRKELTDEQKLAMSERMLQASIDAVKEDMEALKADTWVPAVKGTTPTSTTKEALEAELADLKDIQKQARKESPVYQAREEAKYWERYRKSQEKRLAFWEKRRAEAEAGRLPLQRKKRTPTENAILDKNLEIEKVQYEAMHAIEKANRATWNYGQWIGHGLLETTSLIPKTLMLGLDLSFVQRQGFFFRKNPVKFFQAVVESIPAVWSQRIALASMENIESRPNAREYHLAGIDFTQLHGPKAKLEEMYQSSVVQWLENTEGKLLLPLRTWAKTYAALERGNRTFSNIMKADLYDIHKRDTLAAREFFRENTVGKFFAGGNAISTEWTPNDIEQTGRISNIFSGRGTGLKGGNPWLDFLFLARRWAWSRIQADFIVPIQLMTPQRLGQWNADRGMRVALARLYIQTLLSHATKIAIGYWVYSLLAGDDEEKEPTMEWDPRSSDAFITKIGETRLKDEGGLMPAFVLAARIATGTTKTADGEIKSIYGEDVGYGMNTATDFIINYGKSKIGTGLSGILEWFSGRDAVGKVIAKKDDSLAVYKHIVTTRITPLGLSETVAAEKELGVAQGTMATLEAFFGASVSTYGPRTEYRQGNEADREKQFDKDLKKMKFDSRAPAYKGFLSKEKMVEVEKRRENRKQTLVYDASHNPIRKEFKSDETYNKAVKERDIALKEMKQSGMTLDDALSLLTKHWKSEFKSAKEWREDAYVDKKPLSDRKKQLRKVFSQ